MVTTHDFGRTCERRERRDSIENREQILTAARRLFAVQGVDCTTMHQIGREAQVGQGTLYRNFGHKGDLCRMLLEDDLASFLSRVEYTLGSAEAPKSALDRLGWLLDEMIQMVDSHIPLLAAMLEAAAGPRRHEAFLMPFYSAIHERISGLIQAATEQGEVEMMDAELTADAILASIDPTLFAFQHEQRGFTNERITAGIRRLFVDGLRRSHL